MSARTTPDEIVGFWTETGPAGWYAGGAELDARIRDRFMGAWEQARSGGFRDWWSTPHSALAYLILTDQFPRNMFRDDPRAFATDSAAVEAALMFVSRGYDGAIEGTMKQFFFLPFMHAERRNEQDRAVCLFLTRMPGTDNLRHARAHRHIIRLFGRFPYRNAALGRQTSTLEQAFLDAGGYRAALEAVGP